MNNDLTSLNGPVAILGYGVEGRATLTYLLRHGITDITVLDKTQLQDLPGTVAHCCGNAYLDNLNRFAIIFKSPGFRPDLPQLQEAAAEGTIVTSALSFFMKHCPAPIIGITGTVGKGTTASIAAAALKSCGFTTWLGGNIGTSPLTFLDDVASTHRVVLEISSFQAMDIQYSPHIACILKTTSEHLDWHRDTDEYRQAKANLLSCQTPMDMVVYNADSDGASHIATTGSGQDYPFSIQRPLEKGLFVQDNAFYITMNGSLARLPITPTDVALQGRFNLENIAAGMLVAILAGGAPDVIAQTAQSFDALPHRLELAAQTDRIRYFNDSYATRPDAAIAAIAAFDEPMALIIGGSEKNADFEDLVDTIVSKQTIVFVGIIGATAERLEAAIQKRGRLSFELSRFPHLDAAMMQAARALHLFVDTPTTGKRGVVLMSPACASFGLFDNYKHRGEEFRRIAHHLARTNALLS